MRSRIVALAATTLFAGLGLLWAQAATSPAAPAQPAASVAGCCGSGTGNPAAGAMMDDCKAMMAKHQSMTDEMKAMDARLDALVKAMNESRGGQKADATAAVVTELVAQRKAARESMTGSGCCGAMGGGKASSAARCPMMEGAKAAAGGLATHP